MDETWRPLSRRAAPTELDGLHEDVPLWLITSLVAWVERRVWGSAQGGMGGTYAVLRRDLLREMERRLRTYKFQEALGQADDKQCYFRFILPVRQEPALFLDVLDFLVSKSRPYPNGTWQSEATDLEAILSQGGSAWMVALDANDKLCLQRRVDATVRASAAEVMSTDDRASKHLRAAWDAVYGREPSESEGYREAVRAVEAIAKPVITPNDAVATLGKMIRAFSDAPAKWQIVLTESGGDTTPHDVVLDMLRLLWHGQHDRHGTDDETVPLNVTLDEARAALHLAVTLVQWFRSGAVALA